MLDIFYTKNDEGKIAQNLVFEYCDDNLEDLIRRYKGNKDNISLDDVRSQIHQILQGLKFCHAQNICHRDLKPENVLLNNDGKIKICDFGSAKILDENGKNTPYIVSRYYRAPELILGESNYSCKIDIWATGCIFAELLTLTPLFPGKTEGSQFLE